MRPILSKSTYLYGLQCQKRLFLHKKYPSWANPLDEVTQSIFQTGTNVGVLAQQLFPGGVNAQGDEGWHSQVTAERTAELLPDHEVIYEAAFIYNETVCGVDILVRIGDEYHAFEVKSAASVKPQYIEDAALQYYVLSNAGVNIVDFSIVILNTQYVRIGDLSIKDLFKAESVLERILPKQDFIGNNISIFKKMLRQNQIPEIEMGSHCNTPYACNFSNYCTSLIPQQQLEIEETIELDANITIDKEAWEDYIQDWKFPLYFFDFETVTYGVPIFDFTRPYQQIPFQYSLHVQFEPDGELIHFKYLGDGIGDPRVDLIHQMIRDLGHSGSIVTWNMTFEKGVIERLAIDFPEYEEDLNAIYNRIVDLMPPFRPGRSIYSEAFGGSYSLKNVLPIMAPELSYKELIIQEGGTASFMYGQMSDLEPLEKEQLRKDLLEYCHLDTLAMVKIWERVTDY
jgi:hypothetical protein